jgi:hypothetical protein
MKKPEQWAVKQHLEKNPKCEWICMHINLENLGEEALEMEVYKPSTELFYVIESDGDAWFAHYNTFTNVVESDEVAFGKTPQEALQNFIDNRVAVSKTVPA